MKTYRRVVKERRARLETAHVEQARLVAERSAQKASIEGQLAERRQLLSSIKSEIAQIQAAEQARQAELAAQARARLATAGATVLDASAGAVVNPPDSYAPPPSKYGGVVGIAMQYLGIPYVYGGASPAGFDCSGFVMYVFAQVGISLPHNAAAQYGYGMPVSQDQLQPGDLVFFNGLGHVGIYVGGGSFIHSPHTGDVVKISSISGWYSSTWVGARRLNNAGIAHAHAPQQSLNRLAASATTHCLTGCAIGEVLGVAIGTALGWGNFETIVLAIVLAFLFGYSFTAVPLLRSGLALAAVLPIALAADTFSITVMEIVDNAIILVIPGAMEAGLGDALFWGSLAFALAVAWVAAFP